MERQQVRDAKKHAEHNKQLQKMRESKESERLRIEQAEAEKIGQHSDSSSEVWEPLKCLYFCCLHRIHHMKKRWNDGLLY